MDRAIEKVIAFKRPVMATLRPGRADASQQRSPFARQARRFDHCPDIFLWIEPMSGRVLACSAATRRWLGIDPRELVDTPVNTLATGDDVASSPDTWRAIAHGGQLSDADIHVRRGDGSAARLSASASLIQREPGSLPVGLVIWRDVSQRHDAAAGLREGSRRLQALAYEVTVAESRERERVANGLHDDIGQLLAVAQLKLGELGRSVTGPAGEAHLAELHGLLQQAVQAVRSTTFELHSPLLQHVGLQAAVESLASRVQRWCATRVHVEGTLPPLALPDGVLAVVFRVVRELMLNVQKHAQASDAWIRLDGSGGRLGISVEDNGRGFCGSGLPREFSAESGYGLISGEAQMQAIGGSLTVISSPGKGTHAIANLPLNLR